MRSTSTTSPSWLLSLRRSPLSSSSCFVEIRPYPPPLLRRQQCLPSSSLSSFRPLAVSHPPNTAAVVVEESVGVKNNNHGNGLSGGAMGTTVTTTTVATRRYNTNSSFSSTTTTATTATPAPASTKSTIHIPDSTWSIKDLRLTAETTTTAAETTARDAKVSEQELDTLAYRTLININDLPTSKRQQLRNELGNIMRCISVVTDWYKEQQEGEKEEEEEEKAVNGEGEKQQEKKRTPTTTRWKDVSVEEMYDVPRGGITINGDGLGMQTTLLPLRKDEHDNGNFWDGNVNQQQQEQETKEIIQSLKQQQDKIQNANNGEDYFVVVTGRKRQS